MSNHVGPSSWTNSAFLVQYVLPIVEITSPVSDVVQLGTVAVLEVVLSKN